MSDVEFHFQYGELKMAKLFFAEPAEQVAYEAWLGKGNKIKVGALKPMKPTLLYNKGISARMRSASIGEVGRVKFTNSARFGGGGKA